MCDFGAYDAGNFGIQDVEATVCCHRVLMFAEQPNAKPEDAQKLYDLCAQFHKYVPAC